MGSFPTAVIIAIFLFTIVLTRSSMFKGFWGEEKVQRKLAQLPKNEYIVLNDVFLRTRKGSTQIDHVVVSIYGIFVIETKNYTGWIYGSDYGDRWTKNMYGKKYFFYNPLRQNYGHRKTLEEQLGLDKSYFIPIVTFSNKCKLKVHTKQAVIYMSQLVPQIRSYRDLKLKPHEIKAIANRINKLSADAQKLRSSHTRTIRENVSKDQDKIRQGICPRCNGRLVKRRGRYGSFYGCSNYPRCKYTK